MSRRAVHVWTLIGLGLAACTLGQIILWVGYIWTWQGAHS